jgi:shikimate kinase
LRVSLIGVSCFGTTAIGRILADRRGWPFFDLDEEIERHFGLSIERLQARFLTGYSYRTECAVVLERIATANPDCVIALPPSGLRDAFLRVVRRVPGVTVTVHDTPENILERITFYDIDSRRIGKHLTAEERILHLKEIKADVSYFKRSYERADLQVIITGLDRKASAAAIDAGWAAPECAHPRLPWIIASGRPTWSSCSRRWRVTTIRRVVARSASLPCTGGGLPLP